MYTKQANKKTPGKWKESSLGKQPSCRLKSDDLICIHAGHTHMLAPAGLPSSTQWTRRLVGMEICKVRFMLAVEVSLTRALSGSFWNASM